MPAAPPTKCELVREGAKGARNANVCPAKDGGDPPTAANAGVCAIVDRANAASRYAQQKYGLGAFLTASGRQLRQSQMRAFASQEQTAEEKIRAEFGAKAPTDITWSDFPQCLETPTGAPGADLRKYFGRQALYQMGYQPRPAVGGDAFWGQLPSQLTDRVPIGADVFLNPDLMVLFCFVLLVLVFAVLTWSAVQWKRQAPQRARAARAAEKAEIEAHDPFAGTAFPTAGPPPSAAEQIAEEYEAQGTDMSQWRKAQGLPPAGAV